eukprot:s2124_g8.t1
MARFFLRNLGRQPVILVPCAPASQRARRAKANEWRSPQRMRLRVASNGAGAKAQRMTPLQVDDQSDEVQLPGGCELYSVSLGWALESQAAE